MQSQMQAVSQIQMNDFYGPGTPINAEALYQAATRMGVEVEVLQALMFKETHDQAFLPDGRPSILFEPHVFHHLTNGEFDEDHPDLSTADPASVQYGPGGWHQYAKLQRAILLHEKFALQSCSWGFWQCMGYNYREAGFTSVYALVHAFVSGEGPQLDAFCSYLTVRGFIPALRTKDWATIALKYNGPNYRDNHYDIDLAKFYNQTKQNITRVGSIGPQVVTIEKLLNMYGYKVPIDGTFSASDSEALKNFQTKFNLNPDGVCGPQTLTVLASKRLEVTSPSQSKRLVGAVAAAGAGVGSVIPLSQVASTIQTVEPTIHALEDLKGQGQSRVLDSANVSPPNTIRFPARSAVSATSVQVTKTNADLLYNLKRAEWVIGFESLTLIVLATYITWTKFHDWKRHKGV